MLNFIRSNVQYLNSVSNFTPTSMGSVSYWIIFTTIVNRATTFFVNSKNFSMYLITSGARLIYRFNINTNNTSNTSFTINTLYHITGTWSTTNNSLYINGVLDNSSNRTQSLVSPGILRVSTDSGRNRLNGSMSDFRFYNRVLSLEEIQAIYYCKGADSIYYGLTNRYNLHELPAGQTTTLSQSIIDEVGGLHCTPFGNPLYVEDSLKLKRNYLKR